MNSKESIDEKNDPCLANSTSSNAISSPTATTIIHFSPDESKSSAESSFEMVNISPTPAIDYSFARRSSLPHIEDRRKNDASDDSSLSAGGGASPTRRRFSIESRSTSPETRRVISPHNDADPDQSANSSSANYEAVAGALAELDIETPTASPTRVKPSLTVHRPASLLSLHSLKNVKGLKVTPVVKLAGGRDLNDRRKPFLSPIPDLRDETSLDPTAHVFRPNHQLKFEEIVKEGKDEFGELSREARETLRQLGLKPIPSLHGPISLPYSRCPSGIDAFLFAPSKDVDPWTFVVEPKLRQDTATRSVSVPLPGNARYSQPHRIDSSNLSPANGGRHHSGRVVSSPAQLEQKHIDYLQREEKRAEKAARAKRSILVDYDGMERGHRSPVFDPHAPRDDQRLHLDQVGSNEYVRHLILNSNHAPPPRFNFPAPSPPMIDLWSGNDPGNYDPLMARYRSDYGMSVDEFEKRAAFTRSEMIQEHGRSIQYMYSSSHDAPPQHYLSAGSIIPSLFDGFKDPFSHPLYAPPPAPLAPQPFHTSTFRNPIDKTYPVPESPFYDPAIVSFTHQPPTPTTARIEEVISFNEKRVDTDNGRAREWDEGWNEDAFYFPSVNSNRSSVPTSSRRSSITPAPDLTATTSMNHIRSDVNHRLEGRRSSVTAIQSSHESRSNHHKASSVSPILTASSSSAKATIQRQPLAPPISPITSTALHQPTPLLPHPNRASAMISSSSRVVLPTTLELKYQPSLLGPRTKPAPSTKPIDILKAFNIVVDDTVTDYGSRIADMPLPKKSDSHNWRSGEVRTKNPPRSGNSKGKGKEIRSKLPKKPVTTSPVVLDDW